MYLLITVRARNSAARNKQALPRPPEYASRTRPLGWDTDAIPLGESSDGQEQNFRRTQIQYDWIINQVSNLGWWSLGPKPRALLRSIFWSPSQKVKKVKKTLIHIKRASILSNTPRLNHSVLLLCFPWYVNLHVWNLFETHVLRDNHNVILELKILTIFHEIK